MDIVNRGFTIVHFCAPWLYHIVWNQYKCLSIYWFTSNFVILQYAFRYISNFCQYCSSLESLVKFEVPMTSNVTLKQLCKSQTVFVRYLPDENNKRSQNYNLSEVPMDIVEKQNLKPLQLTPPIVVAWVYHLLRSMTEGITF